MSKYQLRVVVFKEMGHFFPKFQVEEDVPRAQTICKRLTTLPLKIFTQRQFVEDFLRKNAVLFEDHFCVLSASAFGGLRGNVAYAVHLSLSLLVGKRVVDFLPMIMNFFVKCYV